MSNSGQGQFGDTTLTKVFVGGLAWETPMETLRDHFLQFGDILEAVVISDKLSGRSKGYGFVTFKDPEAAKAACEDPTPIINNRRANCNLAVLGARRQKATSPTPPLLPQQGSNNNNVGFGMGGKAAGVAVMAPPTSHLQWYYPAAVQPAASPFHHQHPQAVPFYGYTPAYVAADYNQKVSYNGGAYYPHHMYSGVAAGHAVIAGAAANTLIPMYGHQHPLYHHYQHQQQLHHHHRAQAMGLPAHMFPTSTPGPITAAGPTTLISKPTPVGMQGYGIGAVAVTVGEGLKSTS